MQPRSLFHLRRICIIHKQMPSAAQPKQLWGIDFVLFSPVCYEQSYQPASKPSLWIATECLEKAGGKHIFPST